MPASFIRGFFAIDLPLVCKQQLAAAVATLKLPFKQAFQKQPDPFHWVKLQNLHLTLQFLGQVKEDELVKLLQQAQLELQGLKAFLLPLGSPEWFPSSSHPKVLSLAVPPLESLAALALALKKSASALSYPVEDRPFRGHITLARIHDLDHPDPALLRTFLWPALSVFVKEVVFFRSDSEKGESIYTQLASLSLN
ncbi:MAG TPA: RNA 2',3'-cyclic phosphodiesterase [Gammaproteobacteria bacterium]|nr:RNA 2',3'-cyclic phosphodiesterase [Gammaproteobacteria bacterium]